MTYSATWTGGVFDWRALIDGADDVGICLDDIAASLSNICRFNGHCRRWYSVAEHSVHVMRIAMRRADAMGADVLAVGRCALLHDAAEAYTGDIIRPVKGLPELAGFRDVERLTERAIDRAFGLQWKRIPAGIVQWADNVVLAAEQEQIMAPSRRAWPCTLDADGLLQAQTVRIQAHPPGRARVSFWSACASLGLA